MNESKIKEFHFIYWAHAYWKGISGTLLVGLGSASTVVLGWSKMTSAEHYVALIGITMAVIKSLDMFLDQTMARLAAGKLPVKIDGQNGCDTTHLSKPSTNS